MLKYVVRVSSSGRARVREVNLYECLHARIGNVSVTGWLLPQPEQERGAVLHEFMAGEAVQKILSTAQLSGLLEFWSVCDFGKRHLPCISS